MCSSTSCHRRVLRVHIPDFDACRTNLQVRQGGGRIVSASDPATTHLAVVLPAAMPGACAAKAPGTAEAWLPYAGPASRRAHALLRALAACSGQAEGQHAAAGAAAADVPAAALDCRAASAPAALPLGAASAPAQSTATAASPVAGAPCSGDSGAIAVSPDPAPRPSPTLLVLRQRLEAGSLSLVSSRSASLHVPFEALGYAGLVNTTLTRTACSRLTL